MGDYNCFCCRCCFCLNLIKLFCMLITVNETVSEIVKEVNMLSADEQEQLLVKIRLANYLKKRKRPIAAYNSRKIKPPTMEQIDKWKHESRNTK